MSFVAAPELQTTDWLNTDEPTLLGALRGKVVLIEAFQMLCPGCVSHGLPQAMRAHRVFDRDEVAVVGLHTVFEHHDAQGSRAALAAFLHEYKITFPVGIDAPSGRGGLPKTMALYGMKGTPTLLLVDKRGRLRKHKFGWEDDLSKFFYSVTRNARRSRHPASGSRCAALATRGSPRRGGFR